MRTSKPGIVRPYHAERDRQAIERVWRECGWIEADNKAHVASFLSEIEAAEATVYEERGQAEALALVTPGTFHHTGSALSLAAVSALNTSRVARKRGAGARVLAYALANAFSGGAVVAALGVFERGYYDRLGFGGGTYVHGAQFDPARLAVPRLQRAPERITVDDWESVHRARLTAPGRHGLMRLTDPRITRAEMERNQNGFGLGFRDGGSVTHCLWIDGGTGEEGPYRVAFTAYETIEQYVELMAVLATLDDQVRQVRITETPGTQFEDFLRQPYQGQNTTKGGAFEERTDASAHWQLRIGRLEEATAALRGHGESWDAVIDLTDPIEPFLPADAPWGGLSGTYTLSIDEQCSIRARREAADTVAAPRIACDVAALSRFWMGAASAEFLRATGAFTCDARTAYRLDAALPIPRPERGWDF